MTWGGLSKKRPGRFFSVWDDLVFVAEGTRIQGVEPVRPFGGIPILHRDLFNSAGENKPLNIFPAFFLFDFKFPL